MSLPIDQHSIRNILVIKLRAVGDVLLSTPAVANLHKYFPGAEITFLTEPPAVEVVKSNPCVTDVLVFNPGEDNPLPFFYGLFKRRFDLVIDLFGNPRSAQMTFFSRARYRVGFPFRGRGYAYNIKVPVRSETVHNVEFNLDALRCIGIEVSQTAPFFPIDANALARMKTLLRQFGGEGPLIAVNPNGTWETKRWDVEKFAELADRLVEKINARVLIVWGPGEYEVAREFKNRMRHDGFVPPATSLTELGALLRLCDYVITNDTGPMHIAAAVGTPTLGIFGPTSPFLQGPYGDRHRWVRKDDLDCIACNQTRCTIGTVCMKELHVENVFDAFKKLRAQTRSKR
ncbi:MAG: glycosyltransferase family 9 protein [Chlorobi bacterium]|nr:glycosyltransferase family 9 protein [Chlorobiota bacterium]